MQIYLPVHAHTHQTIITSITQINEAKSSACAHSDGGDNNFFKDIFITIGYLLRITSTKQSRAASRTSLKTPCCAYWRNILASLGRWPKRWNVRIARKQLYKHRWLYSHKHFCIVSNYYYSITFLFRNNRKKSQKLWKNKKKINKVQYTWQSQWSGSKATVFLGWGNV